jgi:hypothetical protein
MRWLLVALTVIACSISLCNDQANTLVVIKGPAVIERRFPKGPQLSPNDSAQQTYPAEIVGYGEDGEHVKKIQIVADHVLAAFDGELLGSDRGEWGGELVFRDKGAVIHRMLEHNIRAIIPMPLGVVVFTGLAHMGMSTGAIYLITQDADRLPRANLLHNLSGAPSDILWTVNDDLVFTVLPGIRTKGDFFSPSPPECDLLDKKGAIRTLPCASVIRR